MKKGLIPILAIVLVIVTIVSFSLAGIFAVASGNFSEKIRQIGVSSSIAIDDTKEAEMQNCQNINIEGVYSEIFVKRTEGTKLQASYKGTSGFFFKLSKPELKVESTNGNIKIIIDDADKINFWRFNAHSTLEVLIPNSFEGNLTVNSVSGMVSISNMNIENLKVVTVSGDVSSDSHTKTFNINTTSGKADISDGTGAINFTTVSGDLNAEMAELTDKLTLKSVSGSFRINLPIGTTFNANLSSVSGKYYPPGGTYLIGGQQIQANSVSGDLRVNLK